MAKNIFIMYKKYLLCEKKIFYGESLFGLNGLRGCINAPFW